MSRGELRILKIWLAVTALAGISLFLGWIVILLLFLLITAPLAVLIHVTPTIWMYLTPGLLLYALLRLALRRRPVPRWVMGCTAGALVIAAGIAVPTLANREIERRAERIMAADMGNEPLLAPVRSIALLDDGLAPRDGKCWDQCQRLLFSGLATTVVQGNIGVLANPASTREPVVSHRIVPIATGCDNSLLQASHADDSEWPGPPPPPYLWEKLEELEAQGRCFRSDWSNDARADIYLVREYGFGPHRPDPPRFDLRLVRFDPPRRWAVLRRDGERLVPIVRRTQLTVAKLAVPLAFKPPEEFNGFEPGRWSIRIPEQRGREEIEGLMRPWLKNDLRLAGLGRNRPVDIVVEGKRRD